MDGIEKKEAPAIEVRNLTKRFGTLTAVDNLSFKVNKGEIFGIVGPDGAGKTTTLRMLSSIMDPGSGTAAIAGYDTQTASSDVKEHLAYMSQRFGLYPDLTVVENIFFYADLYGMPRKGRMTRINDLLGFSHMQPFKQRKARDLSGGMKQKLQLVCALIHTPAVLLLDEPTNGVDPVSRRDFWRILYRIVKQGVSILVTTAYLDEAERCDRIGLLDKGRFLATGAPHDIKQLMKGTVLTIRSPDARKIQPLLKAGLPRLNVTAFGDTIHIVCQQVQATREKVLQLLQTTGLRVDDIKQAPPSLEDVFVSMMSPPGGGVALAETAGDVSIVMADSDAPSVGTSAQMTGGTAVRVDHLTRVFGSFTAVDNLSFQVDRGEIFGFLGPNGAGKSTTIRMLCGLLAPSSGNGRVAEYDILTQAEQIKQNIGYMSQKFSLYEDLTVEENIRFYGGIYGLKGPAMTRRKAWAMEMAGLGDHGKSLTAVLSIGWKQRLALACAILHEPPILFLDEPTSGVDPLSRRRFWELIYGMADKGITVFVTTHYMEEAEYCDRIALIYRGRMIAMGTPLALKTRQMQEQILDVRCDRPQEMTQVLSHLPGIRDVSLFGAGLHVVTLDATLAEQAVRQKFEALGISRYAIEKILPGMEDVFISLIEADDRHHPANGQQERDQ
jgi:ABC-2 type transport system ATP-binding protein